MSFLALDNTDIEFTELNKLIWKFYIAAEALLTTNWVKLINEREFAKAAQHKNSEIFVVYVVALEAKELIHSSQTAQIADLQ